MAIQEHYPNGIPRLLDQYGQPLPLRPDTGRPDGSATVGGLALPHSWTFIARHGGASNTYYHERYDEALRHAREDAEVMRRDGYLMALLQERQLAVSGLPWHLEVPDDKDPYQRRVRDGLKQIISAIPMLRRIVCWLLEALWYGRYGVEFNLNWGAFRDREEDEEDDSQPSPLDALIPKGTLPERKPSGVRRRCLTVVDAMPVNGDKIGNQYDGTPYVLIDAAHTEDLPEADIITTTRGMAMALRGSWRERFVIHRHLMEDADFFASDQAGAVFGVGIRSKLFWLNWLKLEWLGNVTNFFDQVGLGVTLWKYPAGNDAAKQQVEAAARNQSSRAHVLVPVWGESGREALTGVERIEVPTSGADALVKLIDYIDKQLERYVVGQAGSSRSNAAGIGNEAASDFMRETKNAITSHDAHLLGVTLTGTDRDPGLVSTILRYTFPDADFPVKFVFDLERPESKNKLDAGKTLIDMGVKVSEDEFRQAAGYGKPAAGDKTVEPPQQPGMGGAPGMGAPPMGLGGGAPPMGGGMDQPPEPGAEGAEGERPPGAGGDDSPGAGPDALGQGAGPPGDFLQALQMIRQEEAVRYAKWENRGAVDVSRTGLPLYRWYSPELGQSRIQNVPPGGYKPGQQPPRRPRVPTAKATLDVGRRTRMVLAAAMELMFPGGWVRPSGLPALAGLDSDAAVPADVSRDAAGGLRVSLRAPGGEYTLTLSIDGVLTMRLPGKEHARRALHALLVAGVDRAEAGGKSGDLTGRTDESIPGYVVKGNADRRKQRREMASDLAEAFEALVPSGKPAEPAAPAKHAALSQAIRYLMDTGRHEMAREVAGRYARLVSPEGAA